MSLVARLSLLWLWLGLVLVSDSYSYSYALLVGYSRTYPQSIYLSNQMHIDTIGCLPKSKDITKARQAHRGMSLHSTLDRTFSLSLSLSFSLSLSLSLFSLSLSHYPHSTPFIGRFQHPPYTLRWNRKFNESPKSIPTCLAVPGRSRRSCQSQKLGSFRSKLCRHGTNHSRTNQKSYLPS